MVWQGVILIFGRKKKSVMVPMDLSDINGMDIDEKSIPSSIKECEKLAKRIFGDSSDIVVQVMETEKGKAMILYIDGLTNKDLIDRDIIRPLKSSEFDGSIDHALKSVYKETEDFEKCIEDVLTGCTAVFYEDSRKAWILELREWDRRSVDEPHAESVIRGPKEGFTETLRTNTALVRRKIKTPNLMFEDMVIGRQTRTTVSLVYIKGIVNQKVLNKVREQLSKIDTDIILETGHLESYMDENAYSPVSGIGMTQKPDVVAMRLSEGMVAIMCDGTPHVLTVPELFISNLFQIDDYYNRTLYSSLIRVLRLIGLLTAVMLPGLAIAIFTYHQEMMPSIFLASIINASTKTPMPMAFEALILILMFELLREAGTRLPKVIGSAITIVGSLIIGDAAVSAGLVGAPMVIVVALTAVAGFIVPNLTEFIFIYRAIIWFMGTIMGLIGVASATFIMLAQLVSTRSYGIPILSSFSKNEMKDSLFRFPLWSIGYRPQSIVKNNRKRRGRNMEQL